MSVAATVATEGDRGRIESTALKRISSTVRTMVRGRDACWEHCVLVDATKQKVKCNYCHREFSGGVYRMKFHLAQIKNKDIVPCTEVPNDVRDLIQNILSTPKKQKTPKKPKTERVANGPQNSSSASGGLHPNPGSSGQHGSTCPSLLYPRPSPSAQPSLRSPLHAAAAFLNPSIFYNPSKIDLKMRNGFQDLMVKMLPEEKDKIEFTKEHPTYINSIGPLGSEFAVMGRTLNAPGDWWAGYGYEVPTLQRVAIRILSQPCSSHWCRWNWSTFENLYNKKRNRMEQEKFNELVFVHCNLHLQAITQNREWKFKPIIYDEIDVSAEWPTESESSSLLLDDSWLENLRYDSRGSPSTYE
ncbi:hypothetical protein NE237_029378 [Protea cynaroides]|uniref:BED-type domain-containing protein n=1 Tax=Protea cynaroides TaxID=273540 RepID=A0A9Q0JUR2_9MAGN|nr:hypothetical protein NE237_029378 [Protea cynaroides]